MWDESDGTFTVVSVLIGDLDGDCDVDLADLSILLGIYGSCDGDPDYLEVADLDGDDCIGLGDLSLLLAHYGDTCP